LVIPEKQLIVLLLSKDNYSKYKDLVNLDYIKETYRELSYLYSSLFELHEKFPDNDLTIDELSAYFWVKYPTADKTIYDGMLESLSELRISPEVGQGILLEIKTRSGALKLSEKAYKVAQGIETVQDLQSYYTEAFEKVDHTQQEDSLTEITTNLEDILDQSYKDQGLRWRLDCLNKSLGSLREGDFGFIFARPETGKTTFLASEITQMLMSNTRPAVWFNNEEDGKKVMLRIYQAYFGIELDKLLANARYFNEKFNEETNGNFKLFDSAIIGKGDVEKIVAKYQPALVVYDQIDKIRGFAADRDDLRLGAIYQWARELAKNSHAAIGVCQADGTAEGVRYLTMEHVANAKTSKQAEADFILGLGKTHDQNQEYVRFINISKNKLFGDKDSIPDLRHGRFETIIKPEIARYADIIKFE
jgi:KaiC/GvpD/RAD55 family RecA-like ATPase